MKKGSFNKVDLIVLLKAPQQIIELRAFCRREKIDTSKVILVVDRSKDYSNIVWQRALDSPEFFEIIMLPTKSGDHWFVHLRESRKLVLKTFFSPIKRVLILDPTIPLFVLLSLNFKITKFVVFFDGIDTLRKSLVEKNIVLPILNRGFLQRRIKKSVLSRLSLASTYPVLMISDRCVINYSLERVNPVRKIILYLGSARRLQFNSVIVNGEFLKYFKSHPRFPHIKNSTEDDFVNVESSFVIEKFLIENGLLPTVIVSDYSHSLWNMVNLFEVDEVILPLPRTRVEVLLISMLNTKTSVRIDEILY